MFFGPVGGCTSSMGKICMYYFFVFFLKMWNIWNVYYIHVLIYVLLSYNHINYYLFIIIDIYTIFQNCEILACFQTYFVYQSTCTDMHTMFWTCSIISDLCKSRICGHVDGSYFRPGRILETIVIVVCKHFKG